MRGVLAACLVAAGALAATAAAAATCSGRLPAAASWTAEGDAVAANMGLSVAGAGDVDDDGYSDVIVGLPGWNPGCPSACQDGAVYLYRGTALGPSTSPAWAFHGPGHGSGLGAGVGPAGDVNGDGYDDVIFSGSFHAAEPQQVQVHHGSSSGPAGTPAWTYLLGWAYTVWPLPARGAGDVNGDGYDDVIVGWLRWPGWQTDAGRALVFAGSAAGLSTSPLWSVEGTDAGGNVGFSVAGAGDVNADGYDDVLVAAALEVRLYLGLAEGLSASPAWTAPIDPWIDFAEAYGEVASAGDVNGDGYDDVIVGSPSYSGGQASEGRAQVYHGSAAGLAQAPQWTVESDEAGSFFGCSVAHAGDIDCDGYSDVIVGACFGDEPGMNDAGRAFVFFGSPDGLSSSAGWRSGGGVEGAWFGRSVAAAGDVNRDGRADVIVGAPHFAPNGRASVYLGVPAASSGAAPAAPDGSEGAGVPLMLAKGAPGTLTLTWDLSCTGNEMDWEVHAGVLGEFTSHVPGTCTTGGQMAWGLPPPSGDAYFLVVPRTSDREGSYGTDSAGVERPPSTVLCLPQQIAACP